MHLVDEHGENIWMEITRRDDIGADLKALSAARGGVAAAGYVPAPRGTGTYACSGKR
jgi:hypothetical protein